MDGPNIPLPAVVEKDRRHPETPGVHDSGSITADDLRQTVRWALRVIRHGKFIILACIALVLVPTILIVKELTPRYTAEAKIVIEAPETNDLLTDRAMSIARQRITDAVVQTEAELIESTLLARRVIAQHHLDKDPEFNGALAQPKPIAVFLANLNPLTWLTGLSKAPATEVDGELSPQARENIETARIVRAFLGHLRVNSERRSHIISVQFVSEDKEKAAVLANAVAEAYVNDRLEASFEEARRVTAWLGERLEGLRKDVVTAENAVEAFRSENDLRRRNDRQVTISEQQLSELNSRLVIARTDLAQKQARLTQVRTLDRGRGNVDTSSDVLQAPLIQRLREQEAVKARELSEAEKIYADRHPRIVGLRADLGELRSKIAQEIDKIVTSMANDVEAAAAGVKTLERELDELRGRTTVVGAAEVRLRELERQAEANKTLYEAFLNRFKRETELERMQRANARVVSPADVPVGPSYPPSRSIILLAVLASAFGGVALVFLLDRLDSALRSADEAEELTGLPTIAMVPFQRNTPSRVADDLLKNPRSALADSIRSLRTALDFRHTAGGTQVTVVTSSIPKEGKTFVSLCLAAMSAKVDGRVLLIDGDLHRPRLHTTLATDGEVGLANVLDGTATFDAAVRVGVIGTLDFLPAGKAAEVTDLLKDAQMKAFLGELKTRYSRIIIDSPPVLAVADSRVLARLADSVIYLVRWNSTARDAVRNGIKLLRMNGVKPFGTVLSQVNQTKHARYGYGDYGQYYGRYRDYYGE